MGMTPESPDLDAMVAELTTPYVEQARVERDRSRDGTRYSHNHRVPVPSLLDQLRGREQVRGEGVRGSASSAVPVSLEAVDAVARIDLEAARWLADLGEDAPLDTRECLRLLVKLSETAARCARWQPLRDGRGRATCCQWHGIEVDVRRWWQLARVVSGWDGRAWAPDASCPVCDERGGLRIRLADHAAVCLKCRASWGPSTIGLLAAHISSGRGDRRPA